MGKTYYSDSGGGRRRRKMCRLCGDNIERVDYKDIDLLRTFTTEVGGKIIPRRISGNCARHQRQITVAIKRARNMALMPFTKKR